MSKDDEKGRNSLTDEEIFGNLFIYNLAGHETTAKTLAYAVALMSTIEACRIGSARSLTQSLNVDKR